MLSLGALAFAVPWALAALAALPVLWWLLRVMPPSPRLVRFPAIRLLMGLNVREDQAARTPPWVLALRLALAAALILAVAHPLVNPGKPGGTGPLVVAVDDGWASARDWPARLAWLDDVLARAERADRPVILLTTAPAVDGAAPVAPQAVSAARARALAQALEPKPWPVDRAPVVEAVRAIPRDRVTEALWLSDGIDDGNGVALARALQSLGGGLDLVLGAAPRLLLPARDGGGGADRLGLVLQRPLAAEADLAAVRALDGAGRVLARAETRFAAGQADAALDLRMPTELRNRVVRLDLENERGAAATLLLDEGWRRRPVGLVSVADGGQPLLAPLFYVERALSPHAEIHRGDLPELLDRELAMVVLADMPTLPGRIADRLRQWVEGGGVLLRFAGPETARAAAEPAGEDDPLTPVRLRGGGRALGGAMSWAAPQALAPFPPGSPFAGLEVPADLRVEAQVLAEPSLDLSDRSWARLADGTPLVTAARRGQGWVVLVHTSANADWSNLALSGLYVDMLRRLLALAEGVAPVPAGMALPPAELMDGFGRLHLPGGIAAAITGDPARVVPGPRHPPGFYGPAGTRVAVNLAPLLGRPQALQPPPGVAVSALSQAKREIDLKPLFLGIAMALFILDMAAMLVLRGLVGRRAAVAAVLAMVAAGEARAADSFALDATLQTRLAFVHTGDAAADRVSQAGLDALSKVLGQRSTARLGTPMGVDLERDPVLFFPLLYWKVTSAQNPPSAAAAEKLNAYMRAGGLVVIDTGAEADAAGQPDPARMQALTQGLALPALMPVAEDHVLTRSFYLLKELPGRWNGAVWVAAAGSANDGVSPLVVGGNDWAAAWAVDEAGRPLFAAVPGGERQREMAYRFGVNLVMYALTGNYKADQVHLPAILERLGR